MFPQDPTFLWVKSIGGTITENGTHSATDVSENLYITGSFEGTVDFDPGAGSHKLTAIGNKDIYIVKLDSKGNFIWAKSMGSSGDDMASSVTVDKFGDAYLTGNFEGTVDFDPSEGFYLLTSNGSSDIFLQKLNPDGNIIWALSMGGTSDDYGGIVKTDEEANVYLLQSFSEKADLNPGRGQTLFASHGSQDISIQKLTPSGLMVWVKAFGGGGFDRGNDMVIDEMGNIFITGSFQGEMDFDPGDGFVSRYSNGYSDVFTQKFYADGSFAWVKCIGGAKGSDVGNSLKLDSQGNIYTIGNFDGEIIYSKSADTNPEIPKVILSEGGIDIYVQKLDQSGNIDWLKSIGGKYNDFGKEIYTDEFGNIIIVGEFIRRINNNLPDQSKSAYAPTKKGIFIERLSDDGTSTLHKEIANTANVSISSLTKDFSGNVYLVGHFEETADFDPGPAIHSVSSKGVGSTYILKLSPYGDPQYTKETSLDESVSTFPNPVKNKLTIDLGKNIESVSLSIFDVVGNLVKKAESRNSSLINMDLNLNPGVYYVNIYSENNMVTKKIIVE